MITAELELPTASTATLSTSTTMKALVYHGPGKYACEDKPRPTIQDRVTGQRFRNPYSPESLQIEDPCAGVSAWPVLRHVVQLGVADRVRLVGISHGLIAVTHDSSGCRKQSRRYVFPCRAS
jgi:hypothetical protein